MAKNNTTFDISDWSLSDYQFDGTKSFSIAKAPSKIEPLYNSKKDYKKKLRSIVTRIDELIEICLLYTSPSPRD